jgi:deoxyhypusine synthase
MRKVGQMKIRRGMSAGDLLEEYKRAGTLGAGAIARAADIFREMLGEATVFLGLAGPLTASGIRSIISDLIKEGYIHAVVTNGSNVVHDMIEAFNGHHYVGDFRSDDRELSDRKIGRIGNIYTKMTDFEVFEDRVQEMLADIELEKRKNLSIKELLWEIGSRLKDEDSILRSSYKMGVPVFSPGLIDSMLGLQLYFFSQRNKIVLNALKDMHDLVEMVFKAKKTGGIFLGGGVPKHYILGANLLRNGIDYGIQITMDREEAGSLSGAKLEEGISWGKAKAQGKFVSLVGDVTVLFPLLVAAVKEKLS